MTDCTRLFQHWCHQFASDNFISDENIMGLIGILLLFSPAVRVAHWVLLHLRVMDKNATGQNFFSPSLPVPVIDENKSQENCCRQTSQHQHTPWDIWRLIHCSWQEAQKCSKLLSTLAVPRVCSRGPVAGIDDAKCILGWKGQDKNYYSAGENRDCFKVFG